MATLGRFERPTPSSGGWCSIQLSYRVTCTQIIEAHLEVSISRMDRLWISTCVRKCRSALPALRYVLQSL